MPLSSSPLSSTPLSSGGIVFVDSGGAQNLNPEVVIADWTYPDQALTGSGDANLDPVVVTEDWGNPDQSLLQAGSIDTPTAEASVVMPDAALVGSGSASLNPVVIVASWGNPSQRLNGGIQHSGSSALSGQSGMNQGDIGEL